MHISLMLALNWITPTQASKALSDLWREYTTRLGCLKELESLRIVPTNLKYRPQLFINPKEDLDKKNDTL